MSEPDWAPLTGFRVAVTSARRAEELGALLRRRGATVTSAAAITMVALPDDDELRAHTEALIILGQCGRRSGSPPRGAASAGAESKFNRVSVPELPRARTR